LCAAAIGAGEHTGLVIAVALADGTALHYVDRADMSGRRPSRIADGILGHQTRNAIEAFQRDRGLPITGEASAWLDLRHSY